MVVADNALGAAPAAGASLLAPVGGSGGVHSASVTETVGPGDIAAPTAILRSVVVETLGVAEAHLTQATFTIALDELALLTAAPVAPGGNVADAISGVVIVSDGYAESGMWVAAARSIGAWSATSSGAVGWSVVPAAERAWIKQ